MDGLKVWVLGAMMVTTAVGCAAERGDPAAGWAGDDAVAAGAKDDGGKESNASSSLSVKAKTALPIAEVSGLGRRVLGGAPSFLAVGDADATLVTFDVGPNGAVGAVEAHDLSSLFGPDSPQWEAVAGDGAGRVFALSEPTMVVAVLDPGLGDIVHEISLSVAGSALEDDFAADDNSRGEGLALLANGHMLVVKEKDPAALIEFGPAGDAAEGFAPGLALGDGAFALPGGRASEFVVLKQWLFKDRDDDRVPDVSEIAFDAAGRLLLLTDQGRAVVTIEDELDANEEKIDLTGVFRLPSSVDKPEGLVLSGNVPFVASDEPEPGESLFRVSPLP